MDVDRIIKLKCFLNACAYNGSNDNVYCVSAVPAGSTKQTVFALFSLLFYFTAFNFVVMRHSHRSHQTHFQLRQVAVFRKR